MDRHLRLDRTATITQLPPWKLRCGMILGFVQVVCVAADHVESVLEPCVSKASGIRIAASFNGCCKTGATAVLRNVKLTALTRNTSG